ncbi:MAG: transcription initiation factor IIB family protein [Nitrosopumilus sp.]
MVQKTIDRNVECEHITIVTDDDTGELICANCGFVTLDHMVDFRQEWRSFSTHTNSKIRTGSGTSLAMHDQGLSTIISSINKDASGKPLSPPMRKFLKQLRVLDKRSLTHASINKNFIQAFNELSGLKDKLALSNSIMEKAAYIYRKVVEKKLVRGRTISSMMAASLYAACRDTETPRTLKDIADASNIKRKEISRCYRRIYQELDLKMPVLDSIQCIARISSKLEITERVKRYAIEILKYVQENEGSAGKDPMGLAATALYLACAKNGEEKTQREIANAANVTEVTIRNRAKALKSEHYIEL